MIGLFKSKLPSKSKTLKELRKIFPSAELEPIKGGMALTYLASAELPDGRTVTDRAPVLEVSNKHNGKALSKEALAYAALIAAFRGLGYATTYEPGFPTGRFVYVPIPGFIGPENGLAVPELPEGVDPNLEGPELAKAMNEHVRQREETIRNEQEGVCGGSCEDSLECEGCAPEKVAPVYVAATTPLEKDKKK